MIYPDNAATTLYKPRAVEQAVRRAMYGAAGYARGSHAAATVERRAVHTPAGSRQRRCSAWASRASHFHVGTPRIR